MSLATQAFFIVAFVLVVCALELMCLLDCVWSNGHQLRTALAQTSAPLGEQKGPQHASTQSFRLCRNAA